MILRYTKCNFQYTMPNISVDEQTHAEAKILCKTLDLNLGELMQHSILYIKKTGIDPSRDNRETPYQALKEFENKIGHIVELALEKQEVRLEPLLQNLTVLTEQFEEALTKLPKSERFEETVKNGNINAANLISHHATRMTFLEQSQKEIMQANKTELRVLTSAIDTLADMVNGLKREQNAMQGIIETKLGKKIGLSMFQSA